MKIHHLENAILNAVAATTPWLAPIIPASMVYHNMQAALGMDWWVALVGAAVVETLGLSAVHTAFQLWDYNDSTTPDAGRAPVRVAVISGAFYLALVITVNVVMEWETTPVWQIVAKALFSLVGIVGGVILAIRAQHARRIEALEQARRDQQAERERRRQERTKVAAPKSPELAAPAGDFGGDFPGDFRQLTAGQKRQIAALSTDQIAQVAGVSPRTAREWRARLAANGFHEATPA